MDPSLAAGDGAWRSVQRTYLVLTLLTTLSASLIWGINTLFLLDAGLTNTQAFTANAFFTAGLLLTEIPTGVVADTSGRRRSFLLGTGTLLVSTLLYLLMWQIRGPMWGWAAASILIGLGFAFFSGAVEAWVVDALAATGHRGALETVFAKAQVVSGTTMLLGATGGGLLAQVTNLGAPYLVRALLLGLTLLVGAALMRDLGFTPAPSTSPVAQVRRVLRDSIDGGLGNRPVRWLMLEAPFTAGVGIFVFYAMQPYLLELYGDAEAFAVAGLAAAVVAGSQVVGGLAVPLVRRVVGRRTTALLVGTSASIAALALLGLTSSFLVAIALLVAWALTAAAVAPMRQAFINGEIPSQQRATVLSFDSLMGSAGGVVTQPALGRVADLQGYGASYVVSAAVAALGLPFIALARRERASSDPVQRGDAVPAPEPPSAPPEADTLPS